MSSTNRTIASVLVLLCAARTTRADRDIVIETPGERSAKTKLVLGLVAGAGALAGSLGVYWHLDSRSASRDVSANKPTGTAWTAEDVATFDRADRSKTRATIAYSIGGAFLIGAIVALIVTDPPSETVVITPHQATPSVTPTEGGAILGGVWSF